MKKLISVLAVTVLLICANGCKKDEETYPLSQEEVQAEFDSYAFVINDDMEDTTSYPSDTTHISYTGKK